MKFKLGEKVYVLSSSAEKTFESCVCDGFCYVCYGSGRIYGPTVVIWKMEGPFTIARCLSDNIRGVIYNSYQMEETGCPNGPFWEESNCFEWKITANHFKNERNGKK